MGGGRGWGGGGHLLTFSAFKMGTYSRLGAYLRWALIQGWALIRVNTVIEFVSDIVDSSCAKQTDIIRLDFPRPLIRFLTTDIFTNWRIMVLEAIL